VKEAAMARVLVTGGAGFVGANVVEALVTDGHQVTVLDDLSTGSAHNLGSVWGAVRFVQGSVTDYESVRRLVAEADRVIHLAARNIIASTRNPREDYEVNIGGTLNVLLACRERPVQKVVYSSSASIYGNPRYLPINEDDLVSTLSPYAVSKLAGENYCQAFYESYQLPTVVLRYSNVYGPKQDPANPYCGVIARFMEQAVRGEPLTVHGDGEQTRDFTYVGDTVRATIVAAFSDLGDGQTFNVATGIETSVNRLADHIIGLSGHRLSRTHIDRRDIDNIRRRVLNIERIRRTLRWVPDTTLAAGLKLTHEWYQAARAQAAAEPTR
jgi:UDP-glucose 4-epimerase